MKAIRNRTRRMMESCLTTRAAAFLALSAASCSASDPIASGSGDTSTTGRATSTAAEGSASPSSSAGDTGDPAETGTGSDPSGDTSAPDGSDTSSTGGAGGACSLDEVPVNCTRYVSPDGDDNNSGDSRAPLRTVRAALDAAAAGDTICLRDGTYPGIRFRESGEPNLPITVRNEPGHSPVVQSDGVEHGVLVQAAQGETYEIGWIVIAGLEITNGWTGIKMHSAHDVLIQGNHIHDNVTQGILCNAARLTIDANVIAGNGGTESSLNHGLYMAGSDIMISNNLIIANSGYGIQVAGYPFDPEAFATQEYAEARNWKIINNTIGEQYTRPGIVLWLGGTENALVANNVFRGNCSSIPCPMAIQDYGSSGGHTLRNNVFDSEMLTDEPGNADEEDNLNLDAMLVGGGDYHLADGSPAIGAGNLRDGPTHDLDGRLRDAARNDAGAYHFCP